jgi:halorhodopsin
VGAAAAAAAGAGEIFGTLRALTVVLWLGYPIVWAVGIEGFALIESAGLTSWGYSALDVFAKYVFAYLLLGWVAANQDIVERAGSVSAGDAVGTMADDD